MRGLARGSVLSVSVLFVLLAAAAPASAHAVLIRSDPISGASLVEAPRSVRLWFSEDVSRAFSTARLLDAEGRSLPGARLAAGRGAARVVELHLPPLRAGYYGVLWRVLSEDDGHASSGTVVFSVGPTPSTRGLAADTRGPSPAVPDVVLRWIRLCLLAGLAGGYAVGVLVVGTAASRDWPPPLLASLELARRRLLAAAAGCAGLAVAAGVGEELRRFATVDVQAGGVSAFTRLLTASRPGQLMLARQVALLLLVPLLLRLRARPFKPTTAAQSAATVGAAGLLASIAALEALSSHAAALASARSAGVALDTLHVLAALLWLGALPALALTLWPTGSSRPPGRNLVEAVRGPFTVLAAASVVALAASGLYGAGAQVHTVQELWTTPYGRLLLGKSGLLLAMAVLGLANAWQLRGHPPWPWRPPTRPVTAPVRAPIAVEAALGAVILLVAGVLAETPPVRGPSAAPITQATRSAMSLDLVASVAVTPNRPGTNGFTVLVASARRPPPAPIHDVALTATGTQQSSVVALREIEPGHYFGSGSLDPEVSRIDLRVRRGGALVTVALPWRLSPPATPAAPPRGHRLAGLTDGLALLTVAAAVLAAVVLRRARRRHRRQRTADIDVVLRIVNEVLEGQR